MTTVTVSRATPYGRHRMGADAFQPIFYARSTSDLITGTRPSKLPSEPQVLLQTRYPLVWQAGHYYI